MAQVLENSDKGYISGEYSGGAQENIDYEAKTVAIDSGHGGIDPGKISADGILEKDVNLAIASKLKILLEQSGITVIMTRQTITDCIRKVTVIRKQLI